jgi:N-acetylmuramic acid 6-phosphate etherase
LCFARFVVTIETQHRRALERPPMVSTESFDHRFTDIDRWATRDAVEAMLDGQIAAVTAIKSQIDAIAVAAEMAATRLSGGGRMVYVGAGTSGRVAVQDGVELGPTFGWPTARLVYLMAGGMTALTQSAEGAEDDASAAQRAIFDTEIAKTDVVIGVAASGKTPFTVAALQAARAAGALTIGIANNADTPLLTVADHPVLAATGSEIIAGSTRMKAGTAQKAILNMLSTAIMLRLGRVYRGLMVDMVISNDKLLTRAHGIVRTLTDCDAATAIRSIELAQHNIKQAVLIAMGQSAEAAQTRLDRSNGNLRQAIEALD